MDFVELIKYGVAFAGGVISVIAFIFWCVSRTVNRFTHYKDWRDIKTQPSREVKYADLEWTTDNNNYKGAQNGKKR